MAYCYRKKGAWYVGYKDDAGKPTQKSTKARTKTEAARIADELERTAERVRLGLEARSAELTAGELFERWHASKERLANIHNDVSRWRKHLAPHFANTPIRLLDSETLERHLLSKLRRDLGVKERAPRCEGGTVDPGEIIDFKAACPKCSKLLRADYTGLIRPHCALVELGLSAQTVLHLRRLVSRMYEWAIRKKIWTGGNPAKTADLPPAGEHPPATAAPHDVLRLLAAAADPYRCMFAIGVYAGLRSAEILGLEAERVNLITGVILVEKQSTRETTKNSGWRALPIVAELRPYLEAHLAKVPRGRLFPFELRDPRNHLLKELRRTLRRAGLPLALTVHALRHTFISQLSMSGADPRAVQKLAGHADLKTTERYTHLHDPYLVRQAAKLSYAPVEVKPTQAEGKA